jgi:hypothetical protein
MPMRPPFAKQNQVAIKPLPSSVPRIFRGTGIPLVQNGQLNCGLFAVQNRRVLKCKKATRNWRGLVS